MKSMVFEEFLSTPEIQAVFGEASIVQAMMDFEAALARAAAREGLIPQSAAVAIAGVCRAELYDLSSLVQASGRAGSLAIPMVKKLTETVALFDPQAASYVHRGSTSQDVIDTAMALVTRRALALLERDLLRLCDGLLVLAETQGHYPMLGRTLMQPALVTSVGFKLAGWVAPLLRCAHSLRQAADDALMLQLGGAIGTLAVMGDGADAVCRHVAQDLALGLPDLPWHTQRDRWIRLGAEVGVLCGALGKIANDVSLLSQAEVGEMLEPSVSGRGGSTAMPHKRNPVACLVALAAAQRTPFRVGALLGCMLQEHERGLGNNQAELAEWVGLFTSAHGAVSALAEAAAGLQLFPERMRANIDAVKGLVFTEGLYMLVSPAVGKAEAQRWVEQLSHQVLEQDRQLLDVAQEALAADPKLQAAVTPEQLQALFDPDQVAAHAQSRVRVPLQHLREQWQALSATPHFVPASERA